MKKKINRQGYRTLAIVWTLAAAAMAVAFVRRLAEFNLALLLLLALSVLVAANFWKSYRRTPEEGSGIDPFATPPKFADDPILFDDDPNQTLEEKDHE
ncbi:MAG: hypothetical protein HDT35_02595 [Clostridiales bacterium]|nr:hypothetical protein [Clostridiales bacterium]